MEAQLKDNSEILLTPKSSSSTWLHCQVTGTGGAGTPKSSSVKRDGDEKVSGNITIRKRKLVSDYGWKTHKQTATINTPLKLFDPDPEIEDLVNCVKAGDQFSSKLTFLKRDEASTPNPSKRRRLSMPMQSLSTTNFDPLSLFSDIPQEVDRPKKRSRRTTLELPHKRQNRVKTRKKDLNIGSRLQNQEKASDVEPSQSTDPPVFSFNPTFFISHTEQKYKDSRQTKKKNISRQNTVEGHKMTPKNNFSTKLKSKEQSSDPKFSLSADVIPLDSTCSVLPPKNTDDDAPKAVDPVEKFSRKIINEKINPVEPLVVRSQKDCYFEKVQVNKDKKSNSPTSVADSISETISNLSNVNTQLHSGDTHLQTPKTTVPKHNSMQNLPPSDDLAELENMVLEVNSQSNEECDQPDVADYPKCLVTILLTQDSEKTNTGTLSEDSPPTVPEAIPTIISEETDDIPTKDVADMSLVASPENLDECTLFSTKRVLHHDALSENQLSSCSHEKKDVEISAENGLCNLEIQDSPHISSSEGGMNGPTKNDVDKSGEEKEPVQTRRTRSKTKIRRNLPKLEVRHTPMGLPKPLRVKKEQFSVEEIYMNKNFRTPTEKKWETIFEFPKENKDGSISTSERRKKRRLCDFTTDPSLRKQKWKKNKFTPGKRKWTLCNGDVDTVLSQKLYSLDNALKLADLSP